MIQMDLFHQHVGDGEKLPGVGGVNFAEPLFEDVDALALLVNVGLIFLRCGEDGLHQFVAHHDIESLEQFAGVFGLLVDGDAESKTEFGVVFKKRIRPGRAAAGSVLGPGSGGQVAAVDGGASGGIGDDGAVAKELRDQLDVGSFAASGAGAGKLEQRFLYLLLADGAGLDFSAIEFRKVEEEVPVLALGRAQRRLRDHVDGLQPDFALVLDRADVDADAASGAVFGGDLDGVLHARPFFVAGLGGFEGCGRFGEFFAVVDLDANDGVRADHGAFAALNADFRIPGGNFEGEIAFLPARGAVGKVPSQPKALTGSSSPLPE